MEDLNLGLALFVINWQVIQRMKQINGSGLNQFTSALIQPNIHLVTVPPYHNIKGQDPNYLNLGSDEIRILKNSEDKLTDFIQKLGSKKNTPLLKCLKEAYHEEQIAFLKSGRIVQFAQTRVYKMIKNRKLKKNWGTEDIYLLVWILSKYMEVQGVFNWEQLGSTDWEEISSLIPGSYPQDCKFKWLNLRKNKLGDHLWANDESRILSLLVSQHGLNSWKLIAQKLYSLNKSKRKIFRTAKQCKQRWSCYENPNIKKGQWTEEEDKILMIEVYKAKGLRKWCQISKILKERTQNAIKNRFKLILQKEQILVPKQKRNKALQIIKNYLERHEISPDEHQSGFQQQQEGNSLQIEHAEAKSETTVKPVFQVQQNKLMIGKTSAFSQYKQIETEQRLAQRQDKSNEQIIQTVKNGSIDFGFEFSFNFIKFFSQMSQPITALKE